MLRGKASCPGLFAGGFSSARGGFDGDEGRRLLVRYVSEAALKAVGASTLRCLHCSLEHKIRLCRLGHQLYRHPSLRRQSVYFWGFQEAEPPPPTIGVFPFGGSSTALAGVFTMPMPCSAGVAGRVQSRRKTVLDVTPI